MPARSTTWEPEAVIDLETWRRLRAVAENKWLRGEEPSGSTECRTLDPNAYVVCDGPYLVHLADPGINPPNLAAIQEVSAGIYRVESKVTTPNFELWVDDIRLSDPVAETGTAASIDARLAASDVANFNVSYTRQSGQFRQINEDPTYRASNALQMAGNLRLDRFLPVSFGLAMPLQITYARLGVNPELLTGTDLRGEALPGLRKPESWSTNYALTIRRNKPGTTWVTKGFLDPLSIAGSYTRGRAQTELSEARSSNYSVQLNYQLVMRRRGFRLPLGGIAGALPGFIRRSETGKALQRADFSLVPQRVRITSGLTRDEANSTAFRTPVAQRDDRFLRPTLALSHLWRNAAGLNWQPIGMLNLSSDLASTRDLRIYPDSTPLGRLAYNERRFLFGVPVGVERDRSLVTTLSLTPMLTTWLRPRLLSNSSFILSRTLTSREPVRADGESGAFVLPKTLNNSRGNEIGVAVDLGQAFRSVAGDSSSLAKLLGRIRPVDVSTRLTRTSTYDLTAFEPSVRYMLGLGALNEFLVQEGAAALGVSEARVANLASGADLPLGFSFTLSHALIRTTRFQRVSGSFIPTETQQREWPVGNVRWSHTFRGGPLTLLAIGTGFRRREGNSVQGGRAGIVGARSAIESSTITPDAQIGFRNGVSVTLGYSELDQSTLSNGNNTQLDQNDLSGSVNYAFRFHFPSWPYVVVPPAPHAPIAQHGAGVIDRQRNVAHVRTERGHLDRRGLSAVKARTPDSACAYLAVAVVSPAPERAVFQPGARPQTRRYDLDDVSSESRDLDWCLTARGAGRRRATILAGLCSVADLAAVVESPTPECSVLQQGAGVSDSSGNLYDVGSKRRDLNRRHLARPRGPTGGAGPP